MCSQWNKRCANNTRRNIESNSIAGTRVSCLGARESRQEIERDFNTLGLRCWRVPTRELAAPSAVWDRHKYIWQKFVFGRGDDIDFGRENLFQKTLTHSAHREKGHFLNTKFHPYASCGETHRPNVLESRKGMSCSSPSANKRGRLMRNICTPCREESYNLLGFQQVRVGDLRAVGINALGACANTNCVGLRF